MSLKSTSFLAILALSLGALMHATQAQTPAIAKARATGKAADREQFKRESAAPAAPLSPELMAIAQRVQTGRIRCELGHNVAVLPDDSAPGYFLITNGSQRFRLAPVPTTTGAIRLEDKARGGVWLQLANKSMLLDEKNGRRLADECITPSQKVVADAIKAAPPSNILGVVPGTVPNAEPLPQATPPDASAPAASPAPAPLNLQLSPR